MNQKKKKDKTLTVSIMLSSLLIGLIVGVVLGIQLNSISTFKVGYWEGNVEATDIIILTLGYQIRSSTKIRTAISLGNNGEVAISCNCTLHYTSASGEDLATYSFNATINAGGTHSKAFEVEPIDVSQWTGTDVSVFEY